MTTPAALEERVINLEYFVYEQLPPRMEAMNLGATRIYALTVAHGEAIAGLRVDMAAFQTSIHGDMYSLKGALDLQCDSLRKEIGLTRATALAGMTSLREEMGNRFERAGAEMRAVRTDIGTLKGDVGTLKEDVGTLKEDVGTLKEDVGTLKEDVSTLKEDVSTLKGNVDILGTKLDTLIAEIRSSKD